MNKFFVFALLACVAIAAVSAEDPASLNPIESVDASSLPAHEQDKRTIYYAPGYRYFGGLDYYRTYGYPSLTYPSLSYPSYPYYGRYFY